MKRTAPVPRSTDAADYQDLPQRIGAMVKLFPDGHVIEHHAHDRDQLLYSVSGVMRLETERDRFVVPPDRAVAIPAGIRHRVSMHGAVEMRTLYIEAQDVEAQDIEAQGPDGPPRTLKVLAMTPLLRELIVALSEEPMVYEAGSRGDRIARLIEDEIGRAHDLALSVPLPRDPRLQRLCASVLADPSDRRTLEGWAETAGASARTLARLFESDLGLSFGEWRRRVRLHHALEELSNGASVAEAARATGYGSPSAFTAAFGKFTGLPPSRLSGK